MFSIRFIVLDVHTHVAETGTWRITQFKELVTNRVPGFTVALAGDSLHEWDIFLVGPPDTLYAGGYFPARIAVRSL